MNTNLWPIAIAIIFTALFVSMAFGHDTPTDTEVLLKTCGSKGGTLERFINAKTVITCNHD